MTIWNTRTEVCLYVLMKTFFVIPSHFGWTRLAREEHERGTRGAREGHERGTRGAREGHERGTFIGNKRFAIFFILTHLRHDWDTGTVAPKVHKRCTRGAREVHERCTRGAREGHERGTRGAFVGTKGDTVFFILTRLGHGWDTGTLAP